jgi:drug/metabolite transporter (DMT)-like permease
LIFSSIRILGASKASTFEIAYPFFVMLFTYLAFGSAPRRWLLIGGALIFAGATLIISYG